MREGEEDKGQERREKGGEKVLRERERRGEGGRGGTSLRVNNIESSSKLGLSLLSMIMTSRKSRGASLVGGSLCSLAFTI